MSFGGTYPTPPGTTFGPSNERAREREGGRDVRERERENERRTQAQGQKKGGLRALADAV